MARELGILPITITYGDEAVTHGKSFQIIFGSSDLYDDCKNDAKKIKGKKRRRDFKYIWLKNSCENITVTLPVESICRENRFI